MSKYNSTLDISKVSQKMPNPYTPRSNKNSNMPKVKHPKSTKQLNLTLKPTVTNNKMYKNLQMGLPSQKSSNLSSNTASQQNIRRMNLRPSTFLNNIQKPILQASMEIRKQESSPTKLAKQESSPTPSPRHMRVSLPAKMYTPLKGEGSEAGEEKFFYIPKEPETLNKPRESSFRNRDSSNTKSNN